MPGSGSAPAAALVCAQAGATPAADAAKASALASMRRAMNVSCINSLLCMVT